MNSLFPSYNPFQPPIFAAPSNNNPSLAGRVSAPSYNTQLNPLDEFAFRQWVSDNKVPFDPNSTAPQDYDMRGFWQGLQQQNPKAMTAIDPNDSRLHFPDYWKTPIHQTFSNESQWAPPTAPSWTADDKLVAPGGQVVFDDRAQNSGGLLNLLGLGK